MSDTLIWIATGVGIAIIVIKLLVVYAFRRLSAMEPPDQEKEKD